MRKRMVTSSERSYLESCQWSAKNFWRRQVIVIWKNILAPYSFLDIPSLLYNMYMLDENIYLAKHCKFIIRTSSTIYGIRKSKEFFSPIFNPFSLHLHGYMNSTFVWCLYSVVWTMELFFNFVGYGKTQYKAKSLKLFQEFSYLPQMSFQFMT